MCVYFVFLSVVCLQREETMARHFLRTSFVHFFWIFTLLGLTRPPTPCSLPSSTWWITQTYRVCLYLCHLLVSALLTVCQPVTPPEWSVNNYWLLFVQRFVILSELSNEQPWLSPIPAKLMTSHQTSTLCFADAFIFISPYIWTHIPTLFSLNIFKTGFSFNAFGGAYFHFEWFPLSVHHAQQT